MNELILMGLGASLCWGIADYFGGVAGKRVAPLLVITIGEILGLIPLCIAAYVFNFSIDNIDWPWILASAVVGTSSLIALYVGLSRGTMSIVAPIAATGAGIPVIYSIINGTNPSPPVLVGLVIIIVGIVGVSLEKEHDADSELDDVRTRFSIIAGLGAGMLSGVFLVTYPRAADAAGTSALSAVFALRLVSVAWLLIVMVTVVGAGRGIAQRQVRALRALPHPLWGAIVMAGLLDTLATGFLAGSSAAGNNAVASVVASLYPVMTVVLAQVFLRERLRVVQFAGSCAVLAGVIVVVARS